MSIRTLKYFFTIALCIYAYGSNAQNVGAEPLLSNKGSALKGKTSGGDSSAATNKRKFRKDASVRISYNTLSNILPQQLDSGLLNIEHLPGDTFVIQNMGNPFSYGYALTPFVANNATRNIGFAGAAQYLKRADEVGLYKTTKPFTDFKYYAGSKQLQGVTVLHTQDVKARGNFAFKYTKLGTPGYFEGQRSTIDCGEASTTVLHKNAKRLKTTVALAYTQMQQDENGGIIADSLLGEDGYEVRTTIPTLLGESLGRRSDMQNNYSNFSFAVEHTYKLGTIDSSNRTNKFSLQHRLIYTREQLKFMDKAPTVKRYASFLDTIPLVVRDSVFARTRLSTLQNEFGFIAPQLSKIPAALSAAYGFELQRQSSDSAASTFVNQYVKGNITSTKVDAKWLAQAVAQFYFSGISAGNIHLNGSLQRRIGQWQVQINATQNVLNPGLLTSSFASNKYAYTNDFAKQSHTVLGAAVAHQRLDWQVQATQHTLVNYIYSDTPFAFKQYNSPILVSCIQSNFNLKYGKWQLRNNVLLQVKGANAPINLPNFVARHHLLYATPLFKGKVQTLSGLEVNYNTRYRTAAYSPYNAQFMFANNYLQSNAPRLTAHVNIQISRFRAYIAADELLQAAGSTSAFVRNNYAPNWFTNIVGGIYQSNRILLQHYPASNFMLRVGFSWVMVN
ncbi:MAG: hypothetical protein RL660_2140 [Bacteroidota bacterium]